MLRNIKSEKKIGNRNVFGKSINFKQFIKSKKTIANLNKLIGSTNTFTNPKLVSKSKNRHQIQKYILEITKNILSRDTCTSNQPFQNGG